MRTLLAAVLTCALALTGCEKSGAKVPPAPDDTRLLADLPSGNTVLFGGNYLKLQDFMQSALGGMMKQVASNAGASPGFDAWMACFTKVKGLRMVGAVALAGGTFDSRIAFSGMTMADISACAKQAGLPAKLDGDGKFVAIEMTMMGKAVTQPYLLLADGDIYTRQELALGALGDFHAATRADLEADAAAAARASAARDQALVAIAAKADHGKTVWFAGSADGTPEAAKLGELYGSIDLQAGLALDATLQIKDPALADRLEQGLARAKQMAAAAPAELQRALDTLHADRHGDHLHVALHLDEKQLAAIASLMGSMGAPR